MMPDQVEVQVSPERALPSRTSHRVLPGQLRMVVGVSDLAPTAGRKNAGHRACEEGRGGPGKPSARTGPGPGGIQGGDALDHMVPLQLLYLFGNCFYSSEFWRKRCSRPRQSARYRPRG